MMTRIKKRIALYATTIGCLLFSAIGQSATLEEFDERLKKLESEVEINREVISDAAESFKNNMSVTGYADTEYVSTNKASSKEGFRIHHVSLFFKKEISEDWRFFSEIEYEDGPYYEPSKATITNAQTVGSGKIFAEAVNFDYRWRPDTSVRVGRFFTPAGIWSVDHYPPFVTTQDRPQHIRNIFPQLVDGAAITGHHPVGNAFVGYDFFVGNGETTLFDGSGDGNSTTAVGLRAAVSLPIAQQFEVGATLYRDKLAASADAVQSKKDAKGVHAKIRQGALGFQAEYADGSYTPTVSPATNLPYHKKGYYAQFSYDIREWTLGYRHDFYNSNSTTALNDLKINSVFANYQASKNVVLKWEHHLANLENPTARDYYRDLVSVVVNLD
ncbi:MAG: hypothetical protein WAW75_01015 [Gallionella sp.]